MSKYGHVRGCNCPACKETRRTRTQTGNSRWECRADCGCGRCRKIRNLADQRELKRQRRSKPRPSSGGCFISTVSAKVAGLPDDCPELATLRRFRDRWLAKRPGGKDLIAEYYREAPAIAAVLECHPVKAALVWQEVKCCVNHIERGRRGAALIGYIEMFERLKATMGPQIGDPTERLSTAVIEAKAVVAS